MLRLDIYILFIVANFIFAHTKLQTHAHARTKITIFHTQLRSDVDFSEALESLGGDGSRPLSIIVYSAKIDESETDVLDGKAAPVPAQKDTRPETKKVAQDAAWENRWMGETDCSIGPVSRKCCGPNATLTAEHWCACKPNYGCDAVPACEYLRACEKQVAFHINVPRRCTWHNERSTATVLPPPVSKEMCVSKNHTIRFIHIDKTGGSSIDKWYKELYPEFESKLQYPHGMGHTFRLGDGCEDECYVFVVRDPVKRWISRFLMRKRMLAAEPDRYGKEPWSQELVEFPTPNDLAEALSSSNEGIQAKAKHIFMQSEIGAQKRLASWYLSMLAYSDEKQRANLLNRIVFVATTTHLNQDFVGLVKALGLPDRVTNHEELEQHNAMPLTQRNHVDLSELGAANAEKMLSEDYLLLGVLHDAGLIKQTCTSSSTCEY